jgi:hypothetical protein
MTAQGHQYLSFLVLVVHRLPVYGRVLALAKKKKPTRQKPTQTVLISQVASERILVSRNSALFSSFWGSLGRDLG